MIPLASTNKPTAAAGDGFALSAEALLLPLDFGVKKERISGGITVNAQTSRSWVSKYFGWRVAERVQWTRSRRRRA